jgi:hypothetical protein
MRLCTRELSRHKPSLDELSAWYQHKKHKHDMILNEYPNEFVDSGTRSRNRPLQTQYTGELSLSHMLRVFLRNSGTL